VSHALVGVVLFEQRVEAPVVVAEGGADHRQSVGERRLSSSNQ